jgi:uncharacterized protein (TIGR02594 family)
MSWHKAAAVLALAIAPTLATAAHAKDPQRHNRSGPRISAESESGHHNRHHVRRHAVAPVAASGGDAASAWFGAGEGTQMLATAGHARSHQRRYRSGARISAESRRHHSHHVRRHAVARGAGSGGDATGVPFGAGAGTSTLVALAQQYNGTNPIGWASRWCAAFANMILQRAGHSGSGSATARSFARYGRPAPGPAPGVIAVWPHHVGFVIGSAGPGKIRVVSGNHGRRVAEGVYSTRSVIAYRYPA